MYRARGAGCSFVLFLVGGTACALAGVYGGEEWGRVAVVISGVTLPFLILYRSDLHRRDKVILEEQVKNKHVCKSVERGLEVR